MEIPEISNILQNDIISLLYNDIDTSNFKNIILIHDEVQDYNIFIQSANLDSYPIIYNSSSCKDDLKNLLKNKFSNIERISLVFHNEGIDQLKEFIDNEPLFTNNDLNETPHKYSNNLQFIIDLVKDFNIKNLDYLACNTFQCDYWNKYYNIIYRETNVIIGASNNLTGNIKYGGDWVLESTNEDIKNIYFTDNIDEYHYTLSTNISTSTTINQSNIDGYIWPVTINNGSQSTPVVITFGENLTITGTTSYYFIIGSEYIEIDGNNKVVTISGISSYPGLLRNGTSGTSANGYTNISIYNLGVVTSSTTTLVNNGGWICHSYFGKAITSGNITVTNCYSTGAISSAGGGIFGFNTGNSSTGGTITVTKCYSTGNIIASNGGCILGANTGSFLNGGTINITNCYSIGAIATNGGGILGNNTGISLGNGTIKVENCYSSGNITNPGGGILGNNTGSSSTGGTITVTNCYSSGNIGSSGANGGGGIVGNNTRSSSGIATVTVTNCYTIGSIGSSAGGIYGNNNNGGTSSYCIYVGGSTLDVTPNPTQVAGTWVDNNATSTIAKNTTTLIIPSNWIDYSTSGSVPWLLSAFNDTIYDPNTQTLIYGTPGTSNAGLFIGYNYLIFLTNPTTTAITINASTGVLTFPDTLSVGTYTISILVGIITSTVYYAYNSNIYTLTVNKENQTITFNSLSDKVYGDSPFNLTASSTSGLTITYTSSDTSVATISGNTVTIVGAGNSTITASQSGNDYYNAATNVPQNLTVNKASQTITFDSLSDKVYGDQPFNLLASSTSGLTITYTSSDPSVATISGITVTIVGVGTSIITASQPGNNNYNAATNVPQNLTVNKASQTITFDPIPTKSLNDPPFNLFASSTSGLLITYTSSDLSVATIFGNTVTITGLGSSIITASQSGNNNYNAATNVPQTLTVNNKLNQTITFNSLSDKIYGDQPFNLTASSTSGLSITYTSSDLSVATISGITVTIVGAGVSIITASQPGNDNYSAATNVSQTLTVNKASQTITFDPIPTKSYGDKPFDLFASSTSSLSITYTSSDTSVSTIYGNTVTIVGAGTSIITASQSGNSNYNAATNISQNLTVTKKNQTITFDTLSSKIFGDPPFNLTAVNTSNLIISYISSNIKVAVISDSTVIIVGVGATLITASQSGNSNYNSAANVYQNLIVNYGGYNIQLNSPQLAYNENIKKYYLNVIKKNNLNSKKIEVYNKSSYSRIFYPDESISYP